MLNKIISNFLPNTQHNYSSYLTNAQNHNKSGQFHLALPILKGILTETPNHAIALALSVESYIGLGQFQTAIQDLESIISLEGENIRLIVDKAQLQGLAYDYAGAQSTLYRLTASYNAQSSEYLYNIAEVQAKNANYEIAIICLDFILVNNPHHLDSRILRVKLNNKLHQYKLAEKDCDFLLAKYPSDATILYLFGQHKYYWSWGRIPMDYEVRKNLAITFDSPLSEDHLKTALVYFNQALKADPFHVETLFMLSTIHYLLGDVGRSQIEINKCLFIDKNNPRALVFYDALELED